MSYSIVSSLPVGIEGLLGSQLNFLDLNQWVTFSLVWTLGKQREVSSYFIQISLHNPKTNVLWAFWKQSNFSILSYMC